MAPNRPLTPETAAAVWQRAARMQAEAAMRLEERSRTLGESAGAIMRDPHDLSVDEVRAAAIEAGISPEFVDLAIAEQSVDAIGPLPDKLQDAATRFLGTAERSLELSRVIDRPVDVVYSSMQRILPANPWELTLRDVSGDPLNGGSLVFDLPQLNSWGMNSAINPLAYNAYAVDVQQCQLVIRPVQGSEGSSCEILLRAGLQRSVRRNFRLARWSTGLAGALGGGGAAGGAFALGVTGALVALPAVAGAALVGGGAMVAYRAAYRSYLAKFTTLLNDMLGAVAIDAKTGGSFAPRPPSLPPVHDQ